MDRFLKRIDVADADGMEVDSTSSESSSDDDIPCTRKQTRKYKQKVRTSWLQDKRFHKWIIQNGEMVSCKYCQCRLKPKLHGILKHSKTKKHILALSPFAHGVQPSVPYKAEKSKDNYRAELSSAIFIASHTSIRSIDHLTRMQQNIFQDSKIATSMRLDRTKCSAIIKNVLYPYFKSILTSDIGTQNFSLIIDESTDISIKKYVGIVIRYYSTRNKTIVNTFLKLSELEDCTAEGIVTAVLSTLKEFKLDVQNMVGLGTDNANVMVGVNKGVISLLRQHNPNIILIPCICHSIQIAVSSASKYMPSEIEFLVSETYNWFSKSVSRQKNYEALFSAINDGIQPLKVLRACDTRWLSVEPAIKLIVEQWLELKTHFSIAASTESCHKAKLLSTLYSDINLACLQFLKPLLSEVQKVNKLFESNVADPTKLFSDLVSLISNICYIIVSRDENFDPLNSALETFLAPVPQFYYSFEEYIKSKIFEKTIDKDSEKKIRNTCATFLIRLIMQLRQRLPKNIKTKKY